MRIRNKILLYFSITVISLTAIAFAIIYILFSEYREEEFQQQQKEKIKYTIKFLSEFEEMNENIAEIMDELTIHDFYDEKMLVFNKNKELVFSSIDDLTISNAEIVLSKLSPENMWYETKEGDYDLVGMYYQNNNNQYYAISKAYDAFGYTKMVFLGNVFIGIFILIAIVVVLISLYLSNKISKPITKLAGALSKYDINQKYNEQVNIDTSSFELQYLTEKFNELMERTNEAFAFQKHTIQHISHQLKTPLAVLVLELEKIQLSDNLDEIKDEIENQTIKVKSLGSIINVLLEISKIESGQKIQQQATRIDEMIFDVIEELSIIYPKFQFEVNYIPDQFDENKLIVNINQTLVRQAFQNLLSNCISYNENEKAEVKIHCNSPERLIITIANFGPPISEEEERFLFDHFFRGKNSEGKVGFGLGLVLTKKVLELNDAKITYSNSVNNLNVFKLSFPLS